MSELLIDGKENFECTCCHYTFDCDNAVMLKDNLNDEFFVCPNCYKKIIKSYLCAFSISELKGE